MEYVENSKTIERAVLVGLNADCFSKEETATEESLDELEALLETAGGFCTGKMLQNRHTPDPHCFIGEGKAQEVRMLVEATGASMVIFDNELSPGNVRALEEITGVTVLDRSRLIMDIFAQRAQTKEGRLQVELAQYKYLLPRLSGEGISLSRQGGGIGSRGPGETRLETDRRYIRERIQKIEEELQQVRKNRKTQRERRQKNAVPVAAIVGYTNAGKSTLLNKMTGAGIPAQNRLFDTLDTTSRQLMVDERHNIILSDTVGFIAKLPHHLVDAFRATLEELEYADILIHVIDVSDPRCDDHIDVVEKLIRQLARPAIPVIKCYNKCDRQQAEMIPHSADSVAVSALTGEGIPELLQKIAELLFNNEQHVFLQIPYASSGILETLYDKSTVEKVEYGQNGILVHMIADEIIAGKVAPYIIKENEINE